MSTYLIMHELNCKVSNFLSSSIYHYKLRMNQADFLAPVLRKWG